MRFLDDAEAVLWSAKGERARAYLHAPGLKDERLQAGRIGFQPEEAAAILASAGAFTLGPVAGQAGCVSRAGSSSPGCWRGNSGIKIRTNRQHPKYVAISGGHPCGSGTKTCWNAWACCWRSSGQSLPPLASTRRGRSTSWRPGRWSS